MFEREGRGSFSKFKTVKSCSPIKSCLYICHICNIIFTVQELKDLRKSVEDLKRSSETRENQNTTVAAFRVEDQGFHKAYYQYLKGLFCGYPWLNMENEDFKVSFE